MWRNYLTVGVRALAKSRVYAFINIAGLSIGLAACLMLLLYVRYERSYDEWLPNVENVYQVQSTFRDPGTGEVTELQVSPFVVGETLKKDFPQIEAKSYVLSGRPVVLRNGQALSTEHFGITDSNLFDILQAPFVSGDAATALAQNNSVVLARAEAQRLFGSANAMGQTLTIVTQGRNLDLRVTGIIEDWPRNSHQRLTAVARLDFTSLFAETPDFLTAWGAVSGWTYLRLRPSTDPESINSQLEQWERRNIPDQPFGDQMLNQGDFADWRLINVRDVHLGLAQEASPTPGNDERTILTFTIIAFLILGMACVNFTNLATARASARAREVALRKVLGANRRQLMTQFLLESVLVACTSMLLALAMVELLLPTLSTLLDTQLTMTYFGADGMLLPIVVLTLIVGAAGGIYPAFYLSRFQPAQVLKANKSTAEPAGSGLLRNVLVIGQFAVSIGLIICTIVVYAQSVHARTMDPGFRRDGILQISGLSRRQLVDRSEMLAREISRVPGVASVSRSTIGVNTPGQNGTVMQVPGRQQPVSMGYYTSDDSFMRTMGMRLIAGRELTANQPLDVENMSLIPTPEEQRAFAVRGLNIVVNERGARDLGFANPADAVGKQFRMGLVDPENGSVPVTIVGVVANSRLRSIRQPLEPMAFLLSTNGFSYLEVRYDDPDPNAVRERVAQVWRRIAPDVPFDGEFSEHVVAELYAAEAARAQTFAGFALLAVIVACLGLFGLAAFTAERRTKEIGVRKVLGARTGDIVRLLAWQFSKPVIIANAIAWPAAWWLMSRWLQSYDSRVDLGVLPFLAAGALALVVAIGTIASHAFRVARSNPIHALRYE